MESNVVIFVYCFVIWQSLDESEDARIRLRGIIGPNPEQNCCSSWLDAAVMKRFRAGLRIGRIIIIGLVMILIEF